MVHYYDDCFDRYHNEPLSCMGAKASQPTHFLKFRLTGSQLSEINCIINIMLATLLMRVKIFTKESDAYKALKQGT